MPLQAQHRSAGQLQAGPASPQLPPSCPRDLLVQAGAGGILLHLCITSCRPAAGTMTICIRAGWKFSNKHIWGKVHLSH